MNNNIEETEIDTELLKSAVDELISFCAQHELSIPDDIKDRIKRSLNEIADEEAPEKPSSHRSFFETKQQEQREAEDKQEDELTTTMHRAKKDLRMELPHLDLRVKNGGYKVVNYFEEDPDKHRDNGGGPRRARQQVKTIFTAGPLSKIVRAFKRYAKGQFSLYSKETVILDGVDLLFKPGKMYLVLGAPGSGKSTLLRLISGNLYKSKDHIIGGDVSISGVSQTEKDVIWTHLVGYIDQIDRLHQFLTVYETLEFAFNCRMAGTHRLPFHGQGPDIDKKIAEMDKNMSLIHMVMKGLGLTRVKDTFVGGSQVRGVSGGEKKRVTVAEMLVVGAPIMCCDEISTGLDAATTYDITRLMGYITRLFKRIVITSLLQPPPETVANFDELILVDRGMILYSGPVDEVVDYFNSLGYDIPQRMDVADWLQALPTKDGSRFLRDSGKTHLSAEEFRERFYASERGKQILENLESPTKDEGDFLRDMSSQRYKNSRFKSLKLLTRRELLLWWRDKYQIRAKVAQSVVMGIIVGTLFWHASDNPKSVMSILFQVMFYVAIAQMTTVIKQFPDRSIYYKHQDANFFPTWTYVLGRSLASIPTACIDAIGYGTVIYWFVGLAHNDGASLASYFMFLFLLFSASLASGLFFSMFSASVSMVTIAQACMAIMAVIFVLFSGFTVQPDVIPSYYIWIYWLNYFAWELRGLAVNEFESGKYDQEVSPGVTEGQAILSRFGFTNRNDDAYSYEWAWWAIIFTLGISQISLIASSLLLKYVRFATGQSLVVDAGEEGEEERDESNEVSIPFKKVDLTFKDVHYTVNASVQKEKLELLKGIDGIIAAGKMTALMGSSGAGKTTLMDVLAMRKNSGEITGEIRLNGHLQEERSFRRCAGYVEQFDVQSAQLTIRETMLFSAKLRLDQLDPAVNDESIEKFVKQTLSMLELSNIQDLQVGSDETGGLSFEQKKRLSIGVELVANPSIIFLDEPTSGLDARAASIVMRGLRRIANSGRAVCATIHQPSIAIFRDFDRLLLLKRGGEVVFYGDLGTDCSKLIAYLERFDATPKIQSGENPATWMLTTIGAGSQQSKKQFDYAIAYANSKLHSECLEEINKICSQSTEHDRVQFHSKFATSRRTQSIEVLKRIWKVYFRSPSYNVVRMMISGIVALLFSSVYASQRVPVNESDMNSRVNSIFIAVLFTCVSAQNTVLSVFENERNMFYRHKAATMYGAAAFTRAFTLAEIPFIMMASMVFSVLFYFIMGFAVEARKFFLFYVVVFLAFGNFTFLGQMLASLFRDSQTAQGFGSLIVACTSLFSGILLRPNNIPTFWLFMYWVMPGHYIMEGIIMPQYENDDSPIEAYIGTPFYNSLVEAGECNPNDSNEVCVGTAEQWVSSSFPDWSFNDLGVDLLYLAGLMTATRVITLIALTRLDYRST